MIADRGADVVASGTDESSTTIMAYDTLIASSKREAEITPRAYSVKPAWIGEKDYKRARGAFVKQYATLGYDSFEKDADGRMIMPLPLTVGRYCAMVAAGDLLNVIRYSGAFKPTDDGTYRAMVAMDDMAPEIAALYRTGAAYNVADRALVKARDAWRAAAADKLESAQKRLNKARDAAAAAGAAFIAQYPIALAACPVYTAAAAAVRDAMIAASAAAAAAGATVVDVASVAESFASVARG